jgi:hypothetical protein
MRPPPIAESVDHRSPSAAKIALFRSLFRGREDVYARRFESRKSGKSGYQPACANEWVKGVCEKPRIRCTDCPHQRFLPITDESIKCHLLGHDSKGADFVMGIYPMLQDETCFFLAIDFDKASWRDDAYAFLTTCRGLSIPAALERSRFYVDVTELLSAQSTYPRLYPRPNVSERARRTPANDSGRKNCSFIRALANSRGRRRTNWRRGGIRTLGTQ